MLTVLEQNIFAKINNPILAMNKHTQNYTLTLSLNSFSIRITSWSVPLSRSRRVEDSMFEGKDGPAQIYRTKVQLGASVR